MPRCLDTSQSMLGFDRQSVERPELHREMNGSGQCLMIALIQPSVRLLTFWDESQSWRPVCHRRLGTSFGLQPSSRSERIGRPG